MSELIYYDLKGAATITPSLPVQVAREMGRRIVSGAYAASEMIDDENALADRYQVSRVVIRDAVKILVGKGLLEVRRGRGTRVRPRDQWMMWDDDVLAWHLTATPNPKFLDELLDIRKAIEPVAASWAAERASDEDIKRIGAACVAMENEKGSIENFIVADARFHRAVLRAAHNEFLTAMESVIYSALLLSVRVTNQDPRENAVSVPIHRELYEAIASRNGPLAKRAVEKMLTSVCDRLAQACKSVRAYS
ncbi:FadR/GntR family transcriptional regulator [Agaribacterium haliotis]|uniref:FadR/GntR family transcriptional regulator n=1 Tax=Agaribacterium haliotis TaxID=2013869 RepID=UPI000BB52C68|nr:FadR/GntR family transcriptional regulator [Agaribacterium haliotis]